MNNIDYSDLAKDLHCLFNAINHGVNFFEVDFTDLRTVYYKSAMRHHPDRGGDTKIFKNIGEAYSITRQFDPDESPLVAISAEKARRFLSILDSTSKASVNEKAELNTLNRKYLRCLHKNQSKAAQFNEESEKIDLANLARSKMNEEAYRRRQQESFEQETTDTDCKKEHPSGKEGSQSRRGTQRPHPSKPQTSTLYCGPYSKGNCHFGERCVNPHLEPGALGRNYPCRYGNKCHVLICPFWHPEGQEGTRSKRTQRAKSGSTNVPYCRYAMQGHCKFGVECRYRHPNKLCRNGVTCEVPGCPYKHPTDWSAFDIFR